MQVSALTPGVDEMAERSVDGDICGAPATRPGQPTVSGATTRTSLREGNPHRRRTTARALIHTFLSPELPATDSAHAPPRGRARHDSSRAERAELGESSVVTFWLLSGRLPGLFTSRQAPDPSYCFRFWICARSTGRRSDGAICSGAEPIVRQAHARTRLGKRPSSRCR